MADKEKDEGGPSGTAPAERRETRSSGARAASAVQPVPATRSADRPLTRAQKKAAEEREEGAEKANTASGSGEAAQETGTGGGAGRELETDPFEDEVCHVPEGEHPPTVTIVIDYLDRYIGSIGCVCAKMLQGR